MSVVEFMSKVSPRRPKGNRSVSRALEVMELFANRRRPLFITEVAKSLKLPLSSCFGIIKTLERDGFLYALGTRRGFYPTSRLLHLGQIIQQNDPVEPMVREPLTKLQESTGETVVLSQQVDLEVVAIYVIESNEPVRFHAAVGDRWPLYSTSIGRSLLGCVPEKDRRRILARLQLAPLTELTVRDRAKLASLIREGHGKGWHVSEGESFSDLLGVSSAIVVNDQPFAVTVAGPIGRMKERLSSCISALEITCRRFASPGIGPLSADRRHSKDRETV